MLCLTLITSSSASLEHISKEDCNLTVITNLSPEPLLGAPIEPVVVAISLREGNDQAHQFRGARARDLQTDPRGRLPCPADGSGKTI